MVNIRIYNTMIPLMMSPAWLCTIGTRYLQTMNRIPVGVPWNFVNVNRCSKKLRTWSWSFLSLYANIIRITNEHIKQVLHGNYFTYRWYGVNVSPYKRGFWRFLGVVRTSEWLKGERCMIGVINVIYAPGLLRGSLLPEFWNSEKSLKLRFWSILCYFMNFQDWSIKTQEWPPWYIGVILQISMDIIMPYLQEKWIPQARST